MTKKAAQRRHKWAAAVRAERRESNLLEKIANQIADTPAEGINGIAVKLAMCQVERDFIQEPVLELLESAYEAAVKLAGVDLAAQVERW